MSRVPKKKEPRFVAYVGIDTYVEGHGYRVSFVKEGEAGHFPTGDWPYVASMGHRMPWFWGPTLKDATDEMIEYNRKLGIEPEEALRIVMDSVARQIKGQ